LDLLLQARVGFDGTTPTAAMLRLLERNEWNVARVARMIGVTRATVYNRLRRAGAVRKRLRVSPRRRSRPETAVGAEKEPEGRQPTNPSASLGVADAPVLHGTTCGAPIPLKEQPPCDQDPAK
jgi:transposase-like protein